MTKPIVKREYVQEFTKGHGTYTVREQHLARDLERAYTMIEELRDDYALMSNGAFTPRAGQSRMFANCADDLTRILDGA